MYIWKFYSYNISVNFLCRSTAAIAVNADFAMEQTMCSMLYNQVGLTIFSIKINSIGKKLPYLLKNSISICFILRQLFLLVVIVRVFINSRQQISFSTGIYEYTHK